MPILNADCAEAGATLPIAARQPSAVAHSNFIRFNITSSLFGSVQLACDATLLVARVHFFDQMRELLLQQRTLDLTRGRDRFALDLRIKFAIEYAKRFHL